MPFHPLTEPLGARGEIAWKSGGLELVFRLEDPRGLLQDGPAPARKRFLPFELRREDGLWKTTCFEAFFGRAGEESYWELNLGAKGAWNLYRFDSYRSPQPPGPSDDFAIAWLDAGEGVLACRLEPTAAPFALEASLCLVARGDAGTHYLSTRHAGAKPDFHLRESFTLRLEP